MDNRTTLLVGSPFLICGYIVTGIFDKVEKIQRGILNEKT